MVPGDSGVSSGRSRTRTSDPDASGAKFSATAALTDANHIWLEKVLLKAENKSKFRSGSQEAAPAAKGSSDFKQSRNRPRTRTRRDMIVISTSESVTAFSSHIVTRYIVSSMGCCALEYEYWNYYNLLQGVSVGD